jgi:hypothetical protein
MIWKQAHEGAPKNWGGYFCTERTKATQCTPRWYVLASDGKWKPQGMSDYIEIIHPQSMTAKLIQQR